MDVAEDQGAYGNYLDKVLGAGDGTIPGGPPANAEFALTIDAVLDQVVDIDPVGTAQERGVLRRPRRARRRCRGVPE